MNSKTVYLHQTKEPTPRVFYVGCGNEDRPYRFGNRSKEWNDIHSQYGTEVMIFASDLSQDDAFKLEIELIEHFGRQSIGEGFLVNRSTGGQGSKGVKLSEEHKAKLLESLKGKKHSAETKSKMSESQKGKKHSAETKSKISESQKGKYTGEKNGCAKLTEKDVREIIYQIKFHWYRGLMTDLAKKYGVWHTAISAIKHKRSWKHIDWDTITKKLNLFSKKVFIVK